MAETKKKNPSDGHQSHLIPASISRCWVEYVLAGGLGFNLRSPIRRFGFRPPGRAASTKSFCKEYFSVVSMVLRGSLLLGTLKHNIRNDYVYYMSINISTYIHVYIYMSTYMSIIRSTPRTVFDLSSILCPSILQLSVVTFDDMNINPSLYDPVRPSASRRLVGRSVCQFPRRQGGGGG